MKPKKPEHKPQRELFRVELSFLVDANHPLVKLGGRMNWAAFEEHLAPTYHGVSQGYLWVVSRPGDDVCFDWRLSRRHGELTTLLTEDYVGVLQSDGYEAYAAYARAHPGVAWVGCWAHARRKFIEAQGEKPKATRVVLKLIARLYRLERAWDGETSA